MRQGFPKSVDDCRRMQAAHQAETGYLTCPVAAFTRIMPNYGEGGGFHVAENNRPIVTFFADQGIKIQTYGTSPGRLARINACLPFGYSIRQAKGNRLGHKTGHYLMRHGTFCERFICTIRFTPIGALVEAA